MGTAADEVEGRLEALAGRIREHFANVRDPFVDADGVVNLAVRWADERESGRRAEAHDTAREAELRALLGRRERQMAARDRLRAFLAPAEASVREPVSANDDVRRLERVLAGVSSSLEAALPDAMIRAGEGSVVLTWTDEPLDAKATLAEGGPTSLRLLVQRECAAAGVAGKLASDWTRRIVGDLATARQLTIPDFACEPKVKPGERPAALVWRKPKAAPAYEGRLPSLPPRASLSTRGLADEFDALLARPSVVEFSHGVVTVGSRAGHAVDVVAELAKRTERSPHEIEAFFADLAFDAAVHADPDALSRPIADLNLSVRARKCMSRLNITTLGELVQRTDDVLLEAKNFGMTTLNEIRDTLARTGLTRREM